jgi:hypothetical protein
VQIQHLSWSNLEESIKEEIRIIDPMDWEEDNEAEEDNSGNT